MALTDAYLTVLPTPPVIERFGVVALFDEIYQSIKPTLTPAVSELDHVKLFVNTVTDIAAAHRETLAMRKVIDILNVPTTVDEPESRM